MNRDCNPEKVEELLISHLKEKNVFQMEKSWTIRDSPLSGYGVYANRDIRQNELIIVDAPLIIGPRAIGKHLQMCVCCYKKECALFPCDRGCGLPVCSVECKNSSQHANYECEYLRSLVPNCGTDWSSDLMLAVVPIRALFLTGQQRECLATFQSYQADVYYELDLLTKNVVNLPTEEDMKLMKHVCGAFYTNAFETVKVHDKDHSSSLRALYPMAALQNHCCVPNTSHHFDAEFRLYVNTTRPISAGEELTMTYTSLFWDNTLRRQFLSTTKHFSCMCGRCSDSTEFGSKLGALLCASDKCPGQLLPRDSLNMKSPWACDTCTVIINHRQIHSIRSGIAAVMEEVLYKTPRQVFKFMRRELRHLVPRTNYLLVDVKFRIISYYGKNDGITWQDLTDGELNVKANYCNDLLSILDTLGCGDCQKRGLILYELYCTNFEKMKRFKERPRTEKMDENEHLLQKALAILRNDAVIQVRYEHDKQYFK
ncbi:SET domain-containing protein SmydA-8-like isoform X2 [Ceratina calcarata]|uniref:SET domain-containing protein SmydA-8-like isoform X2 n=1 Tax=Ceratina calcarata TaxID=156304 RepID=A0AAJ7J8N6_9HYME|nr:SET domain-containing protein SmydA-8-like isoform X2 [Ceratina calcarata]